MDAALYLSTAAVAERLIAAPVVAARWADDSALVGYTVGGVAGHLARAVLTVPRYLDGAGSAGEPIDAAGSADEPIDAAGYFVRALAAHDPVTSGFHQAVRDRSGQEAADGPGPLLVRLEAARRDLAVRLAELDADTRIAVLDGTVLTLNAYLDTRLVELVVHLDDLAVSVDRDIEEELAPQAYATVAAVLARVAVARAGGLATVRSLARRERQPAAVRAL